MPAFAGMTISCYFGASWTLAVVPSDEVRRHRFAETLEVGDRSDVEAAEKQGAVFEQTLFDQFAACRDEGRQIALAGAGFEYARCAAVGEQRGFLESMHVQDSCETRRRGSRRGA